MVSFICARGFVPVQRPSANDGVPKIDLRNLRADEGGPVPSLDLVRPAVKSVMVKIINQACERNEEIPRNIEEGSVSCYVPKSCWSL